jgi:NAD(P)H-hydrate repair Nnr-like enzyme with NAD(P)H-hydrate epimerase domain
MVHVASDDRSAAVPRSVAEADLVLDGIVGIGGRPVCDPRPRGS